MTSRRTFLRLLVVSAGAPTLGFGFGCAPAVDPSVFPQGVASADPGPDSILLWTRVEAQGPVQVGFELAEDEGFERVVASGEVEAHPDWDHTVRVRVEQLPAASPFYYRFTLEGAASRTGRTRTAPPPDADVPVRFATASCQDYIGRWYHPWAALLEEPDLDFVLFLGDWIYETVNDPRHQVPVEGRSIELPHGLPLDDADPANLAARSLADYRTIHRTLRTDAALQDVLARWPLVAVWDDHEFTNDCWQDHANEFDGARGEERATSRREAASRAWFEYVPAVVSYDPQAGFPDDIRTYRRLRWGARLELALSDVRYYRDDHVVPEGPPAPDVGKILADSPLGARIFARKDGFDVREAEALPTMLGEAQRDWLLDTLTGTDARWRVWATPVLVAQQLVDLRGFEELAENFRHVWYFKPDQWDGFRTERRRILEAVGGPGFVVLSGDLHGFYAAELKVDFDDPEAPAVGAELMVSSISSIPLLDQLLDIGADQPLLAASGLVELMPLFDEVLTTDNPHLVHADSAHNGVAVLDVGREAIEAEFLVTGDPRRPEDGGVKARHRFLLPWAAPGVEPA